MPVLGYIPKPAEEDYGPRIARDLYGIDDRRSRAATVNVVDADDIGQKDPVEFATLCQAG